MGRRLISEFFINLGAGIAAWFLTLLPDSDWDDGMTVTAANAMSSVFTAAGQISNWFPWTVLSATFVFVMGAYVALFMAKVTRWLWGLTPLSGGS